MTHKQLDRLLWWRWGNWRLYICRDVNRFWAEKKDILLMIKWYDMNFKDLKSINIQAHFLDVLPIPKKTSWIDGPIKSLLQSIFILSNWEQFHFQIRLYICSDDVKSHTAAKRLVVTTSLPLFNGFVWCVWLLWDSNSPIHHDQGICPRLLCPVSMTSIHTFVCKMKFSSLDDPQLDFNSTFRI